MAVIQENNNANNANNSNSKQKGKHANNSNSNNQLAVKGAPMIVDRFYRYPMVNFAVNLGYAQYDKLKTSNVTVGEVMTKAESLATYFWQKVLPIVEKFQEPISKADKLACDTLDFVETKINQVTHGIQQHQQQATQWERHDRVNCQQQQQQLQPLIVSKLQRIILIITRPWRHWLAPQI